MGGSVSVVGGLIVWLIGWFMKKKGKPQSLTHTQHHHHQGDHQPPRRDQNAAGAAKIRLRDRGKGRPQYRGILHGIYTIAKEEGVARLYRGLLPRLLRVPPGMAITWCVGCLWLCGWVGGVFVVVCLVVVGGGGGSGGWVGGLMFRSWGLFFFLGGGGGGGRGRTST